MSILDWQQGLGRYLRLGDPTGLGPELATPALWRRLQVYRHNVAGSLAATIAAAFPATRHAAGAASFAAWAESFVAAAPPTQPSLWTYGAGFPAHIEVQAATAGSPWLAALGRLEWASQEALFAAEAEPLSAASLAALATADPLRLRLAFHPAVQLLRSRWRLLDAWHAWRDDRPCPELWAEDQDGWAILVGRPRGEVAHRRLGPWQGGFVGALLAGASLGEAAATCPATAEVAGELTALLGAGLCVGYSIATTREPPP